MNKDYENFEIALDDLKSTVSKFENTENLTLEELLKNYERGMKAYNFCMKKLEDTQKKIKIIESDFE